MNDSYFMDYIKPRLTQPVITNTANYPEYPNSYPDLQLFLQSTVGITQPNSKPETYNSRQRS
jgi:hypothetical protein